MENKNKIVIEWLNIITIKINLSKMYIIVTWKIYGVQIQFHQFYDCYLSEPILFF